MVENLFLKNPLQDLLSILNVVISINESTRIIAGHVIYNPAYTYKFLPKTTLVIQSLIDFQVHNEKIYSEQYWNCIIIDFRSLQLNSMI